MKRQKRTKEQIVADVTANWLKLADVIVGKSGPVKTYRDFCHACGLYPQNFSAIQKRERMVPLECAALACEVFNCSLNWMFANQGDMFERDDMLSKVEEIEERLKAMEKKLKAK